MLKFTTGTYINNNGLETRNEFLIFTDQERNILKEMLDVLTPSIPSATNGRKVKGWNKWDHQASHFLKKILHYNHGGEMLDPSIKQIKDLVDLMIKKVLKDPSATFERDILGEDISKLANITREQQGRNMERKRKILALYKQFDSSLYLNRRNIPEEVWSKHDKSQFIDYIEDGFIMESDSI